MTQQLKCQSKGYQIKMALNKKTDNVLTGRNKVKSYINRWDDFRERREVIIDRYIYLRKRQECAYYNTKLAMCLSGLKGFMKFFKEEALRIRAREKIKIVLTKSLVRYRNGMLRFGHDFFERNQ